ncbi:MAG: hypothetical protein LBS62_05940 [Clostridiales bacterium]|nr:hypothetical protein [Clostridiales bacterium]
MDGLHFESADQGRCHCGECARLDDFAYHAELNTRAAAYVKEKWPGKIVMINMVSWQSWDKKVKSAEAKELELLRGLARHTDYIIDPGHLGHYIDESVLPSFTSNLPCAFGNAGGFWTYYWPAWDRLRAFLPYTKTAYDAIRRLYAAGGRAVEYYTGPMINPGAEINTAFAGCVLSGVEQSYGDALERVLQSLYQPKNEAALKALAKVVTRAEESWFERWTGKLPASWKPTDAENSVTFENFDAYSQSEASRPSQIFLDGVKHLTEYIEPGKWASYRKELELLRADAQTLYSSVAADRMERMLTCFEKTIQDLNELIEFEAWK